MDRILNNPVVVGMIKGRHELPVEDYIFNEAIEDIHDYESIRFHIWRFINNNVGVAKTMGYALNGVDGEYVVFYGVRPLIVYVTGLTPVIAELIAMCASKGVVLTLMNYDLTTGEYIEQVIFD